MAELERKQLISDDALQAPVQLADNLSRVVKELDKIILSGKGIDTAIGGAKSFKEVRIESEKLSVSQKELAKQSKAIEQAQARLNPEYKKGQKELLSLRTAQQASTQKMKEQAKEASGLTSLYQKQSAKLNRLRKEYKDLALENKHTTKEGKELREELVKLDKKLKDVDASVGQHQRSVGNYPSAFDGIKEKIGGVTGGFSTATLAAGGFAAAAVAIGKAYVQESIRVEKNVKNVIKLTQLGGIEAENFASRAGATAAVFDKEFNEVMRAGNVLMKEFGATSSESFDTIDQLLVRGVDLNDDFLEQISEYSTFIDQAGGSMQDMINIVLASEQAGIFSDKGLDSIKEATVKIREMTPVTREAIAGLGLSVNEIEEGLRKGTTSVMDVIKQVSSKMQELPPISTEVGAALADIFGGAGEDAGTFVFQLAEIINQQGDWRDSLSDSQKAQIDLLEATNEYDQALISTQGNFDAFMTLFDTFVTNVKTVAIGVLGELASSFTSLGEKTEAYRKSLQGVMDVELLRKQIEKQNETIKEGGKWWQLVTDAIVSFGTVGGMARRQADRLSEAIINRTHAEEQLQVALDETKKKEEDLIETRERALSKTREKTREGAEIDTITDLPDIGGLPGEDAFQSDADKRIDILKNHLRELEDSEKASYEKRLEDLKDFQKERLQEIGENFVMASIDLYNARVEGRIAALELENDEFQAAKEKELEFAEGNEERQQAIREQMAAKEEATRQRVNKLRRRQAIADKAVAVAQTIINTALAITQAFAQLGPIAGIPVAVALGALGAVQTATIIAQPIPQFAKGVGYSPEGPAIINEQGPELMQTSDGRSHIVNSDGPALTYLQRGTRIHTAKETQDILNRSAIEGIRFVNTKSEKNSNQKEIINELREVKSAIKRQKSSVVNVYDNTAWSKIVERDYA